MATALRVAILVGMVKVLQRHISDPDHQIIRALLHRSDHPGYCSRPQRNAQGPASKPATEAVAQAMAAVVVTIALPWMPNAGAHRPGQCV